MLYLLYLVAYLDAGFCLWAKGVVHYAIDSKDYDLHSQEIITGALSDVQRELCVKFFAAPTLPTPTRRLSGGGRGDELKQILLITNPDKLKTCPPHTYNFTGNVVEMPIGYTCVTARDVAGILVDMLRASIQQAPAMSVNSYDLIKKFQEQGEREAAADGASLPLVSAADRNYINAHYHAECGALGRARADEDARRADAEADTGQLRMTPENERYYQDMLWPLGVVLYDFDASLQNSPWLRAVRRAMASVELASCVVFERAARDGADVDGSGDVLRARSLLWFDKQGADEPQLGFYEGNQSISLASMAVGAPGHRAHTLGLVLRALGLPAVSNRHDRDYYVDIHWNNVQPGKEHLLERSPAAASLGAAYDFESATHAPTNYMCRDCRQGQTTVQPTQDHLWQRSLSLGRGEALSAGDSAALRVLYASACRDREALPVAGPVGDKDDDAPTR